MTSFREDALTELHPLGWRINDYVNWEEAEFRQSVGTSLFFSKTNLAFCGEQSRVRLAVCLRRGHAYTWISQLTALRCHSRAVTSGNCPWVFSWLFSHHLQLLLSFYLYTVHLTDLGGLCSASKALGMSFSAQRSMASSLDFYFCLIFQPFVGYLSPDAPLSSQIERNSSRTELIFLLKVSISVHEITILSALESGHLWVIFVSSNSN